MDNETNGIFIGDVRIRSFLHSLLAPMHKASSASRPRVIHTVDVYRLKHLEASGEDGKGPERSREPNRAWTAQEAAVLYSSAYPAAEFYWAPDISS